MRQFILVALLILLSHPAFAADKQQPLKLAVIAPVLEWDDVPEIKRLCDWMEGHYNLKVTWIQPDHPPHDKGKEAMKAYYQNPPPVKGLEKAWDADVVYTAITHVKLNKADTQTYLQLLLEKPVVGGKRCHHALMLSMDKDESLPDGILKALGDEKVEKDKYIWPMAVFGCVMGGHHGGKVTFNKNQAGHPIVDGLDELLEHRMTKRGYKYKQIAKDVAVLIESEGQPQVWVRQNPPAVKRRVVYVGYDPEDFDKLESLRRLMARAVFWAAGKDHKEYQDG